MDLIDALNSSGDLKTLELLMMYEMLRTENVDLTARVKELEALVVELEERLELWDSHPDEWE